MMNNKLQSNNYKSFNYLSFISSYRKLFKSFINPLNSNIFISRILSNNLSNVIQKNSLSTSPCLSASSSSSSSSLSTSSYFYFSSCCSCSCCVCSYLNDEAIFCDKIEVSTNKPSTLSIKSLSATFLIFLILMFILIRSISRHLFLSSSFNFKRDIFLFVLIKCKYLKILDFGRETQNLIDYDKNNIISYIHIDFVLNLKN